MMIIWAELVLDASTRGKLKNEQTVAISKRNKKFKKEKITRLSVYKGLKQVPVTEAKKW